GSALAAAVVPITVPAPGRVSTTMVCPKLSVSLLPTTRLRMSAEPPGANGTMILIGLSGYLSAAGCAWAPAVNVTRPAPTAQARRIRGTRVAFENHIGVLPRLLFSLPQQCHGWSPASLLRAHPSRRIASR